MSIHAELIQLHTAEKKTIFKGTKDDDDDNNQQVSLPI